MGVGLFQRCTCLAAPMTATGRRHLSCVFSVVSQAKHGIVAGVECRLAEPWPQEGSIVFAEDGSPHAHTVADGVIAFATQSGRSYRVCPTGFAASSAGTPAPVIAEDEEPYRLGIGGSFSRQYPDQNPWRSARGLMHG